MTGELRRSAVSGLGLESALIEGGAPSEEAIVFLHANPGSSRDWEPLLAEAARFARVIAFDLPGFGAAEKPREWDYSAGTYGAWIAAVLSELSVRRAHLVMHDLGGVGLVWAAAVKFNPVMLAVVIVAACVVGLNVKPVLLGVTA